MRILALETASDACSTALLLEGECIERHAIAPRRHAELLLAQIDALLEEAGVTLASLDALAFGRGPGSFTGLRIASGVVQGLAVGAGLGVVPVSSLRAVAQGAVDEGAERALVAFDARMGEVYFGAYELAREGPARGLMVEALPERVCPPEALDAVGAAGWTALGEGWAAHRAALEARFAGQLGAVDETRLPRARHVAEIAVRAVREGATVAARDAVPVYLRERVASPAPRGPAG